MATLVGKFNRVPLPVRLLTFALLGGGLLGGMTNFLLLAGFWPWDMPPLAHRFLAGAAAAYVVGSAVALSRPRWVESELLNITVLIYGVALVAAIALEPNLIDWSKVIAWLFVAIVTAALIVVLAYTWQQRGSIQPDGRQALGAAMRSFLIVLGIVATVVGALVYLVPKQAGFVWPWAALSAWKPLDSRLIASMLLTIGGGSLYVVRRNDRGAAEVFLPMLWAYCIVAGAGIALHAAVTPAFVGADTVYIVIFAIILVVSITLLAQEKKRAVRTTFSGGDS